MGKIKIDDASVATRSGEVVLSLPVDGRQRRFVLDSRTAMVLGAGIANAGADCRGGAEGLPLVEDFSMLPFQGGDLAILRFTLRDFGGPVHVAIDQYWLRALAAAAEAALEHGKPAGNA